MNVRDMYMVISVSADVLAPNSVVPSVYFIGTVLMRKSYNFLPLSPSGWRGIVVTVRAGGRVGGRPGGRLPNLRNPYLCNRLTDFLHSKFYGIV